MGRRCCATSSTASRRAGLWLALLAALLLPRGLAGQRLVVEGEVDHPAARLLHEIAAGDTYRVIARDTVLPATFRHPGDLVVAGADVRLEGAVEGSVAVLGGGLFVRPGARVGGRIVTAQGTAYVSTLAEVGETLALPLAARVEFSRLGDTYTLRLAPPRPPPALIPPGLLGLGAPTYDRVNGATLRYGVHLNLSGDTLGPRLRAAAAYHTARAALGGRAILEAPLGRAVWAGISAGRVTRTNEEWIRGDLANSLAALTFRSDARNYHRSDFVSARILEQPAPTLEAGEGFVAPLVELRASRDRSLDAREPWSLFGDEWRPNPPVFEGTLASAIVGGAAGWRGATSRFAATFSLEQAFAASGSLGFGDLSFSQLTADGRWDSAALWSHVVSVRTHLLTTLGPDPAPPQRWSFVGGPGTLPTLEFGALRGDNLVFVESAYAVPLPRVNVPLLGVPSLALRHAVGTAWVTGFAAPRWEQNLGLGVQFRLAEAFLFVNPAEPARGPALSLSVSLSR